MQVIHNPFPANTVVFIEAKKKLGAFNEVDAAGAL
jgi:hypothetical protein